MANPPRFRRRAALISLLAAALCALPSACVNVSLDLTGPRRAEVREHTVRTAEHGAGREKIVLIDLRGIVNRGDSRRPGMLVGLRDRLERAEKDSRIAGLVLAIDSPGGTVTASALIHREITEFKRRMEKKRGKPFPVFAHLGDVAASGGVYIAMAADEIEAVPTVITGSIGVIMTLPGFKDLADKVGLEMRVIKSADLKDIGSPWRDMDEQERAVFQRMITERYDEFLEVILASRGGRGMNRDTLLALADGRIFGAREAVDGRLIDRTAYLEETLTRCAHKAGVPGVRVVTYEYPGVYRGHVHASSSMEAINAAPLSVQLDVFPGGPDVFSGLESGPRMCYLWIPSGTHD